MENYGLECSKYTMGQGISMITLSESAKEKIKDILNEESSTSNLRVFVNGGGCAGFSYGFVLDDQINEDDFSIDVDEVRVLIDSISYQYLEGSVIDYKEELVGSSFTINNPNVETTCGCGSSFSMSSSFYD